MEDIIFYHNPRCSKSREALALLNEKGYHPVVIEYLKTPLTLEELRDLSSFFTLKEFVRTNEKAYKEMGLSLDNEERVLEAMVQEPKLMQRPIVMHNGNAIIARPPELALTLFE